MRALGPRGHDLACHLVFRRHRPTTSWRWTLAPRRTIRTFVPFTIGPPLAPPGPVTLLRNPPQGFRLSPFDLVFLAVGVLAAVLTRGLPGDPSTLIGIVVGHFFLFCNVVRLRRSFELAWAGVFVALAVIGWGLGVQRWFVPLAFVTPYTVLLVLLEVRSGRYHGAGADGRLVGWLAGEKPARRPAGEATWLIVGAVLVVAPLLLLLWAATGRPAGSRLHQARIDIRVIRQAASAWQLGRSRGNCPSLDDLVQERFLDEGVPRLDPWNRPYLIECDGPDVTVTSAGPDGAAGTADDVRVPQSPSSGQASSALETDGRQD